MHDECFRFVKLHVFPLSGRADWLEFSIIYVAYTYDYYLPDIMHTSTYTATDIKGSNPPLILRDLRTTFNLCIIDPMNDI
jgi:hypothetical protein